MGAGPEGASGLLGVNLACLSAGLHGVSLA